MMDMEPKSKMESLLELIKEMKRLQGEHAGNPDAMEVEIHAQKLDPKDLEAAEEASHEDLDNDQEEGESPEHKAKVLGDEDMESSDEEPMDEDQDEMQIPEGLMKLLAERLHK